MRKEGSEEEKTTSDRIFLGKQNDRGVTFSKGEENKRWKETKVTNLPD
jgi:hypothetical protein